jgi:peroxiredoxin
MTRKNKIVLLLAAGLAGAAGGWWFSETYLAEEPGQAMRPSSMARDLIGQQRPDFSLGGSNGQIISVADYDQQVLLINFWATWCKPCREEMPMLSNMHDRLSGEGFTVLGIALDDVEQARAFIAELGITYPNAVGGADVMAVGVNYGNNAGLLPYSVLIDRQGRVNWTSLGELDALELEERVVDLL